MRITKLYIKKLFGTLDISVEFPNKANVNIMYGPNGLGKTTVLSMIDALFNLRYKVFEDIPFDDFKIHMDNGMSLELIKKDISVKGRSISHFAYNRRTPANLQLLFNDGKVKVEVDFVKLGFEQNAYDRVPPWFKRLDTNLWLDLRTRARYTNEAFTARYPRFAHLQQDDIKSTEKVKINTVKEFLKLNRTYFIDTQRLRSASIRRGESGADGPPTSETQPNISVDVCSKKLIEKINRVSLEYSTVSQTLERTFPQRLIKHVSRYSRAGNLLEKLNDLEKYRKELLELGLSEPESVTVAPLKSAPEIKKFTNVLSLYLADAISKLDVYKDLYKRVKLFMELIGKRFNSKTMKLSALNGIQFYSGDAVIPLSKLSSGEQHELVMVYNLLFEVSSNTTVLIDEPEISLHVCWQEEFLKDLEAIGSLVGHNFIVATHSPSIINEHWGLATELKNAKN